jgi:predicted mannosyl-3-phosphoglycerate phosphatase (HAD superfamily)
MAEGLVNSLIDKKAIEEEIKSVCAELEKASSGVAEFGKKISDSFKEAVLALQGVKQAANFTELRDSVKKTVKETEGLTAAQKALAAQEKTLETLSARLASLESQEAVAIQKVRLEIAEKTKQQKTEAQAMIAAGQAAVGQRAPYRL